MLEHETRDVSSPSGGYTDRLHRELEELLASGTLPANSLNTLLEYMGIEPGAVDSGTVEVHHEMSKLRDGAGTHAVATLGRLIFDAAEASALPLSRASLDRCVGKHLNGATFSHVARAVRLVPGKSVRKRLARSACE